MKRLLIAVVCLLVQSVLFAQSTDFGAIVGAEATKKFSHFGLTAEAEGRFNHNFTNFSRLKLSAGADYTFFHKRFKVGTSFNYIYRDKTEYYENMYKLNLNLSYSEKIKQFKIGYRARFQFDFYDNRTAYHKLNPKIYMRNRFEGEYSFFSKPLKIAVSEEFFWRLNHPSKKIIDALRTIISLNYRIDKSNSLTFFLRADNEVQVSDPENIYYVGIIYHFKD